MLTDNLKFLGPVGFFFSYVAPMAANTLVITPIERALIGTSVGTQSWGAAARAHVQGSFPDLGNGWTDCAQIWYTVRDRLVGCRAQVSWDPFCTCARAGCRFQI